MKQFVGSAMERVNQALSSVKSFLLSHVQRGNEAIETQISFVKGCADFAKNRFDDALAYAKGFGVLVVEGVHEAIPYVNGFVGSKKEEVEDVIPHVKEFLSFAMEKFDENLPYLIKFVYFVKEKTVKDDFPNAKGFVTYSFRCLKQHPFLFGFVFLYVWWKIKAGCEAQPMMKQIKAPGGGGNCMISREGFEKNPKGYLQSFREMRKQH